MKLKKMMCMLNIRTTSICVNPSVSPTLVDLPKLLYIRHSPQQSPPPPLATDASAAPPHLMSCPCRRREPICRSTLPPLPSRHLTTLGWTRAREALQLPLPSPQLASTAGQSVASNRRRQRWSQATTTAPLPPLATAAAKRLRPRSRRLHRSPSSGRSGGG